MVFESRANQQGITNWSSQIVLLAVLCIVFDHVEAHRNPIGHILSRSRRERVCAPESVIGLSVQASMQMLVTRNARQPARRPAPTGLSRLVEPSLRSGG